VERRADWTYERAPAGASSAGIEGYDVEDGRGERLGKVTALVRHGDETWVVWSDGMPPLTGTPHGVLWDQVEVDHDASLVELRPGAEVLLLDGGAVEAGKGDADAVRLVEPPDMPPPAPPGTVGSVDRASAIWVWITAILAFFAMLVVAALIEATRSPWPLVLLVIPGAFFAVTFWLGRRSAHSTYDRVSSPRR
jgi:hypothetical protein